MNDALLDFLSSEKTEVNQIRDIVPIKEWIKSRYYLGDEVDTILQYWADTVVEFFEGGFTELILSGSTGTGKSYCSLLVQERLIYELSCYKNPAELFNISKSSLLLFFYLCVTQKQAESTGFGKIKKMIDVSPYFNEVYPRNKKINSIIKFPEDKINLTSGSDTSDFIGTDLFCLSLDEANFLKEGGGDAGKFAKAQNIYREATNRRQNRFTVDGKEHGASIIISSSDTMSSFTEERMKAMKNDPSVLIKTPRVYDIKPHAYPGERFWVFKGNDLVQPFIVNEKNINKYNIVVPSGDPIEKLDEEKKKQFTDVPIVPFLKSFEMDIINSLKEVAGVPSSNKSDLMNDTDKYKECVRNDLFHPFTKESITVSTADKQNQLILNFNKAVRGNKEFRYYFGIDMSTTFNKTGLSLGHYENGKYVIDMMLQVLPPFKPEQIKFKHISEFVLWLRDEQGFNITNIVLDTYETTEMQQFFRENKFEVECLSVDRTKEPYLFLFNKIVSGEISYYDYGIFKFELLNLITTKDGKIDHPPNPSKEDIFTKDVTDAVCRIINVMSVKEIYYKSISTNTLSTGIMGYIRGTNTHKLRIKPNAIMLEIKKIKKEFKG